MPELTMSQIDKELLEDRVSRANGGLPWKVYSHQVTREDYGAIISFKLNCGDICIKAQSSTICHGIEKLYGFNVEGSQEAILQLAKEQHDKFIENQAQFEAEKAAELTLLDGSAETLPFPEAEGEASE